MSPTHDDLGLAGEDRPRPLPRLTCPRCGKPGEGFAGCLPCRRDGVPVNLSTPHADLRGRRIEEHPGGPWGWADTLPLSGSAAPVSLGEGNTPLLKEARGGRAGALRFKLEYLNPTSSHKDRAMAVAVTRAVEVGATTVVAASSGNAGAAAAAYAARAGLRCVILTTPGIPSELHAQIRACGAAICVYEDSVARNRMVAVAVEELGWFPVTNFADPGPGSNAFAIDGYKSIAYEIARDRTVLPQVVVVPTSRGDLLAGVYKGLRELVDSGLIETMPKLVAAEPATGAALTAALDKDDVSERERTQVTRHPSPAFSVGGDAATWQGLEALTGSGGWATSVDEDAYLAEYQACSAGEGIFMEPSSAVGVAAARDAVARGFEDVLTLVTSGGLKDHQRGFFGSQPRLVVQPEGLDHLRASVEHQARALDANGGSA